MEKKISIIIPVYNTETYLERCIVSVINQTYRNLEILLVDDGSTDGSLQICREFEKQDPRIRIIEKENGGLSSARNAGIEEAAGEYFMFVDSDDCIHQETISRLAACVLRTHAEIAVCNRKFVYSDSEIVMDAELPALQERVFSREEMLYKLVSLEKDSLDACVATNKLVHRSLFKNLRFMPGRWYEDEAIMHHLMFQANCVAWDDTSCYFYYQREGSIMHQKTTEKIFEQPKAYKERADLYIENGIYESEACYLYLMNLLFTVRQYEKGNPDKKDRNRLHRAGYRAERKRYYPYLTGKNRLKLRYRELRVFLGRCRNPVRK